MDKSKSVQNISTCCSEEIVEKSKFLVQFRDFDKDFETMEKFVSEKVKLLFIDAEWWVTISPDDRFKSFTLIKVHISRSAGQVQHGNFKFRAKITGAYDHNSDWYEMANDKLQYESNEIGYLNPSKNVSLDMVLTIKRVYDLPIRRSTFSNSVEDYFDTINDVCKMKDDSTFADFTFVVRGKEFKIHKNILAAKSPVFARIFTSNMQEARENVCIVNHFKAETFDHLLEFIYRAKLPTNFPESAQAIYEAADYYDLKRLKEVCDHEIRSLLSKNNAVELYCWAYAYDSLDELKKDSWEIVKREILQIFFRIKNEPMAPEALKTFLELKNRYLQSLESLKEDA